MLCAGALRRRWFRLGRTRRLHRRRALSGTGARGVICGGYTIQNTIAPAQPGHRRWSASLDQWYFNLEAGAGRA